MAREEEKQTNLEYLNNKSTIPKSMASAKYWRIAAPLFIATTSREYSYFASTSTTVEHQSKP